MCAARNAINRHAPRLLHLGQDRMELLDTVPPTNLRSTWMCEVEGVTNAREGRRILSGRLPFGVLFACACMHKSSGRRNSLGGLPAPSEVIGAIYSAVCPHHQKWSERFSRRSAHTIRTMRGNAIIEEQDVQDVREGDDAV